MGAADHTRKINPARTLDYNTALAGRATGADQEQERLSELRGRKNQNQQHQRKRGVNI